LQYLYWLSSSVIGLEDIILTYHLMPGAVVASDVTGKRMEVEMLCGSKHERVDFEDSLVRDCLNRYRKLGQKPNQNPHARIALLGQFEIVLQMRDSPMTTMFMWSYSEKITVEENPKVQFMSGRNL